MHLGGARLRRTTKLVMLVSGGALEAQAPLSPELAVRLGLGLTSTDYTCTACQINAEKGITAFVAAMYPLRRRVSAGLEATYSDASSASLDARLLSALATAGAQGSPGMPVWGTLGHGWMFWSGPGPNANGPALSLRGGVDLSLGGRVALSPYAGYLTMLGHDGPRHVQGFGTSPDGVRTRLSSVQLGVAATLRL